MKVSKSLQSRTQENDKRILDAASNLRDGALGKCNQGVFHSLAKSRKEFFGKFRVKHMR